jgi:hypothetical protein
MKEMSCSKEMPVKNPTVENCVSPVSDEQRKKEAYERHKQTCREYYWRNREKILALQKKYYIAQGKEKNAARMRKYRRENKEKVSAQRKAYRAKNIEKFKVWDKKYRQMYKEKRALRSKEYWETNRECLLAYNREYRENKKYALCYRTLNRYCFKSMEQIRCLCPDRVNYYMIRYPFEEYAERHIKKEIYKNGIYPSQAQYADCYDAGMLAYLYSIHRCAAMNCNYAVSYIRKMIRIYIICALVVYRDAKNLCRTNGFREIRLDADAAGRGY